MMDAQGSLDTADLLSRAAYDALDRAHAHAGFARDRVDASSLCAQGSDRCLNTRTDSRSAEHLSLRASSRKPRFYSLLDHCSFKFIAKTPHI
jgi:hypothetical protein